MPFLLEKSCGDAGAVKRTWLRTKWLSAYEGSNPSPRIHAQRIEVLKNPSPLAFQIKNHFLASKIKLNTLL